MSTTKQSRRKTGAQKLEPIDWHEFANDAVLNGNMSTLYHRPLTEDPSAYASPEALVEIEKRAGRPPQSAVVVEEPGGEAPSARPTVGMEPAVGMERAVGTRPTVGIVQTLGRSARDSVAVPTVGTEPTVGLRVAAVEDTDAAVSAEPTVGTEPTVGMKPTVGLSGKRKVKPIRDVQDALTLAGQVLYKAMYGAPDGAKSKSCTKGYRQLANETHLDKDTVRDLIGEFKAKGMVRETSTYDPDTRSAKTYEILSYRAILQIWRDAGMAYVTAGRQRPVFCTAQGEPVAFRPTVGPEAQSGGAPNQSYRPTVGMEPTVGTTPESAGVVQALQQIAGIPVDQEAADRLVRDCRAEAPDCTVEEIVEFAWSKAFLCRSGKIENPIGFLITQVPKHFQGSALESHREQKRTEIEAAARLASREEQRQRKAEQELAEVEERQRVRGQIAERYRAEQGIDLKRLLQDAEADEVLKDWARRMLLLGRSYPLRYD